ncbi:MAG TPA: hypothetical protein DCX32_02220 [Candidatus Moranbacteria bacterium]|nr:MAG: N-acetylmuramyl-L-alanine amidase, negative regulator of AmpC, AmpD [Candidatus Moranbacteria bacterium GW2011_GWC2_45_10]KKT95214.1 MAG: N-acetylmuramyl-L-alanine amidase, negative regulator of AmpC, AmpD [Parcubacteria group bacterium GW2011_GWC1_45_14]HAV11336.1 hypothetical protein [Candidatus Moranbacteria bacterium]
MDKKKAISIVITVFFVAGMAAWYIFYGGKAGKMEISQESGETEEKAAEPQVVFEQAPADEDVRRDEIIEKSPEEIIEQFKQEQKKPTETVIKPEEIIKEPAQAKKETSLDIEDRLVSFGFQKVSGERKIDTVILHSSFNSLGGDQYDVDKIIDIYKSYGVSAHYIIGRNGTAYRLVKDNDVSYHAGVSSVPDGRTNINAFSIGIEIVGNYDDGYTSEQYEAVSALIAKIKGDYDIKYVLGHDDIAPGRKTDPWNFDWDELK